MAKQKQQAEKVQQAQTPKKKLTFHDFRVWLSGVEEMQDEDWTPSATQWRTIREKIEDVVDAPPQPRRVIEYDNGYDDRPMGPIRPAGPSAFVAPPQMPQQPTALAVEQNIVSAPNEVPTAGGVRSGGLKIKTPNIDTSKGGYVAAFE